MITAVDGETIDGPRELARKIGSMAPGKDVEVTLWRDGKSETVKLTLGELPADREAGFASTSGRPSRARERHARRTSA